MAERRRTLPPGVTAGRRGRPTRRRTAAEAAEIRAAARRQEAAIRAAEARRRRPRGGGIILPPPPPPPPAFAFFRLPDQSGPLWRWLYRQGRRPVWATTVCDKGHLVHLWERGGWRADNVLRRALLSYGGPEGLQDFFRDQADENTVSPCEDPIIGVTVGRVRAVRRPAA